MDTQIQELCTFAPIIVAVMAYLFQLKVFVTPAQLEKKHREIMCDCEGKFGSKEAYDELKADFKDAKEKIDKIYELVCKK